jgi:hypothetical protein
MCQQQLSGSADQKPVHYHPRWRHIMPRNARPRPDIDALIADIDEHVSEDLVADFHRLSFDDQHELSIPQFKEHRRLRNLIHHAFYYHNQGWMILSAEESCALSTALTRMRRLEDEYFHQFSLEDDLPERRTS